ncbi:MAG: group II intron reverse transcriptase/maturase [Planctomycetota bacterium]|jgi:group II intron reverse transcriptase/maturase
MSDAKTSEPMSPELQKVVARAREHPKEKILSLAHRIDVPALERAFHRLRDDAAVGVDGVTKAEYGRDLERRLQDLHGRLKTRRWRHQPIRRVHIPKGEGKTRPIGISCLEDKIVQDAVREVLEAIYEQDFLDCSYGCRPGRSAHDALRALNRAVHQGGVQWIIEADIVSYFDRLVRTRLKEMLRTRVADESLMRLVGKCLHVGVLHGEEYTEPEEGTAQGSVLSPLLGNVYLHYVLDLWFEREIKPRLRGRAFLIRYVDDFVIALEDGRDAERVMTVLPKRMGRFGLTLHSEKTRLLPISRPKTGEDGKRPATFDFLGFTHYWRKTRGGGWMMWCKTMRARRRRVLRSIAEYCWRYRHVSVKTQHAALVRRIQGHYNYFGVNGNLRSLERLEYDVSRVWLKWLRRRSQRSRLTWERFRALLAHFPLPVPRISVQIWDTKP